MRWVAVLVLLGCAGPPRLVPKQAAVLRVGQGPAVALAGGTPSDGVTLLAMYIDAGSRDGRAPYAAAIAAELLAQNVGRAARGQAFPDGIEVLAVCDDGVRACAARLALGLALRHPSDALIGRALAKLKGAEQAARAEDPARGADELAVQALWPGEAAAFLPLELRRAASDKDTFEAVRELIADAFGPSRALVAASGPISLDELAGAVGAAFAKAPPARRQRATRELPASEDHTSIAAGVDASAALSFAIAASTVERATRAVSLLRDELIRSKLARAAAGHASSVRGGAIAILRVSPSSADVAPIVSRAGYIVARMRIEGVGTSELPLPRDEPAAALRRLGARFVAGAAADDEPRLSLGVGVLVRGDRADRVGERDPDRALRESERARLSEALRGGAALATPQLAISNGAGTVEGVLQNSARIAVHELASDQVAIAVRLRAGAASDPPAQHGRAALLASVMTVACAGRSPAALRAELASLGATLEPAVSAGTLGFTLRARAAHADAAIALAVECALQPSLARGDVTRARLVLRERLGFARGDTRLPRGGGELRAEVARAVSSERTPGALAPWGAMTTLASVDERALSELLDRALRGPNTSVAIAGALGGLDGEAAAMLAARRLSRLPRERAAEPTALPIKTRAPKPPANRPGAVPNGLPPQAIEALLVWSTPACARAQPHTDGSLANAPQAARAFAAAMSAALTSAELNVPWLDGDCRAGVAWAALLVRGPAERIARLHDSATRAAAELGPKPVLEAAARSASKHLATEAGLASHAEALAEAPFSEAPPAETPAEMQASTPAAVIARLRTAPVRTLPAP